MKENCTVENATFPEKKLFPFIPPISCIKSMTRKSDGATNETL
jgi:hypothetical protein